MKLRVCAVDRPKSPKSVLTPDLVAVRNQSIPNKSTQMKTAKAKLETFGGLYLPHVD